MKHHVVLIKKQLFRNHFIWKY